MIIQYTKLSNIVVNSEAGNQLTPQEKINYLRNVSYSDGWTTKDVLQRFRDEVKEHLLNDRLSDDCFNWDSTK